MRGASSMVKKVSTAMVARATIGRRGRRAHREGGGRLEHLGDLRGELRGVLREVFLQVQPEDEFADRALALLGLVDQVRELATEVAGARHQRLGEQVDQADEGDEPEEEHQQHRPAVAHVQTPLHEAGGRREEERDEEGDHDVEDDGAQDPEAEDECRVEVQQQNDDGNRGDDGGQGHAPALRTSRESGPPGMAGTVGHGDSLAALTAREALYRTADVQAWDRNGAGRKRKGNQRAAPPPRVRRKLLPRNVKITLMVLFLFFVGEYVLLPELASARKEFHQLSHLNFLWLVLGVLFEIGALVAYAELTRTVLSPGAPSRFRIFRINMWALTISHTLPGGTVPGSAASYRLLTEPGAPGGTVSGSTAAFGLATQGIGSAVVLNVIFWLALLISIPLQGYNPLYGFAAILGVLLIAIFAGVVYLLTRGEKHAQPSSSGWPTACPSCGPRRSPRWCRRWPTA